jgi:hypothetical protein
MRMSPPGALIPTIENAARAISPETFQRADRPQTTRPLELTSLALRSKLMEFDRGKEFMNRWKEGDRTTGEIKRQMKGAMRMGDMDLVNTYQEMLGKWNQRRVDTLMHVE